VIDAVGRRGRALLRRARSAARLAGVALDKPAELGWRGIALRARMPPATAEPPSPLPPVGAAFDVIYAIGYWPGEPKRYRVFNMAEGLRSAGYAVHVMPYERIDEIARRRWSARALVLFRAEYDPLAGVADALAHARAHGTRLVYDIDDLLFDDGVLDRIDGIRAMGRFARRRFGAAIAAHRRLMLACDRVTVSTVPLARAVEALGRSAAVVPNGLNVEQIRLAGEIAARTRTAEGPVRLGYFSGSPTHQRDFAACEPALLDLMRRRPELRFRCVGYLDLGPAWKPYAERVERLPLQHPSDLLRRIAETDINLAPLELGNPFCEAKSELKFFEAALVGVPTVASATEPFAAAIEDGVSGFLARTEPDWRRALDALVAAPERRTAIGAAGRARALARHAPAAVIPQAVVALGLSARG
jgi:glycosyltransferase involved in cell wall biosynthesis